MFNVGDVVRIRADSEYYGEHPDHNPADTDGSVYEIEEPQEDERWDDEEHCVHVEWTGGYTNCYRYHDLELADKSGIPLRHLR